MFPGSPLILGEACVALYVARDKWFDMGVELGLPLRTLEVIEGHAVSSTRTLLNSIIIIIL